MMTIIEYPTPPAEPDRSTRWKVTGVRGAPLHYVTEGPSGAPGWTWGTKMHAVSWSKLLEAHRELFPLTEIPKVHRIKLATSGDSMKGLYFGSYDTIPLVALYRDGKTRLDLDLDEAVHLRDFLNQNVITEDTE